MIGVSRSNVRDKTDDSLRECSGTRQLRWIAEPACEPPARRCLVVRARLDSHGPALDTAFGSPGLFPLQIDLNAPDARGLRPIHLAAMHGMSETVRALVKAGVQVDAMGAEGNTALHLAAFYGQEGVVAVLVEAGEKYHRGYPSPVLVGGQAWGIPPPILAPAFHVEGDRPMLTGGRRSPSRAQVLVPGERVKRLDRTVLDILPSCSREPRNSNRCPRYSLSDTSQGYDRLGVQPPLSAPSTSFSRALCTPSKDTRSLSRLAPDGIEQSRK